MIRNSAKGDNGEALDDNLCRTKIRTNLGYSASVLIGDRRSSRPFSVKPARRRRRRCPLPSRKIYEVMAYTQSHLGMVQETRKAIQANLLINTTAVDRASKDCPKDTATVKLWAIHFIKLVRSGH